MKIRITVKTGKGQKSTRKDINKTVDILIKSVEAVSKKFKWTEANSVSYPDGTGMVLEKENG